MKSVIGTYMTLEAKRSYGIYHVMELWNISCDGIRSLGCTMVAEWR